MCLALKLRGEVRAGEPDIFLVAPAPDFFSSGSCSCFFPQAAPAPARYFFSSGSGSKRFKFNILLG